MVPSFSLLFNFPCKYPLVNQEILFDNFSYSSMTVFAFVGEFGIWDLGFGIFVICPLESKDK